MKSDGVKEALHRWQTVVEYIEERWYSQSDKAEMEYDICAR